MVRPILNIAGERFGILTAVGISGRDNNNQVVWLCKCDCGNSTKVRLHSLRGGRIKSCGCKQYERVRQPLQPRKELPSCPHCNLKFVKRSGYQKGSQRYFCLPCQKYFTRNTLRKFVSTYV